VPDTADTAVVKGVDDALGTVGRAVVDYEHLKVPERLRENAGDSLLEILLSVVDRKQYRDLRHA
jgi:hypothetical protein